MQTPPCPISDNPAFVPGSYIVQRPAGPGEPTTRQMLQRLCRRLSEPHHPFNRALEMARHRELTAMNWRAGAADVLAQIEAQRAEPAQPARKP